MKLCPVICKVFLGCVLFCDISPSALAAETPQPADVIIFNAKVVTVNSNFMVAEAIAVRGDQIVAVGKDRQVEKLKGPATRMIDAKGRTVMPGCDEKWPGDDSKSPAPVVR